MDKSLEKTMTSVPLVTSDIIIRRIYLDFQKNYRHLAWDILVYFKMHPKCLKIGDNQKIYDHIRDLQIRYRAKRTPGWSDEEVAYFVDFMSDLEAQHYKGSLKESIIYYFDQEEINTLHPDLMKDEMNQDRLMFLAYMHAVDRIHFYDTYEKSEESENESDCIVPPNEIIL